ncbi:pentatricopeptide repeat-containing protein At4g16390, chloroplastic-like [Vicia villosa]|uniref:pentatricopeptide repeat-containing protein At4g16390, chloroplastic-like n=1 Tax=Vicia villosa TaxID=3911 RepID=UPI00273BA836|nr:pentatricopeptide repeat-containing protein At4g16390, chloroplastic-like [Vicia villosa]
MAYRLCSSSASSLFHDPPSFSLSSSKPKLRNSPSSLTPQSKIILQSNHVSLQQPIPQQQSEKDANFDNPVAKSTPSKNSHIWVNPKSPRAKQFGKKSYDARYTSLAKLSNSLDSCDPNIDDVSRIFESLGDNLIEKDAVIIINNMENSVVVPFVLRYIQSKIRGVREVVLYNVTLKVFRKCRDFDGAEKVFDEMVNRGVKPNNVTFSTIISCARSCNLPNKAVEWFEKMPSFGIEPDDVTYAVMIDSYGKAGYIDMAVSLYDRARTEKWRLDNVTFSTMIKMYRVAGNYDGCLNIFEEMKALGVKPNLIVYTTLLDAMGRAKRPWQAKSIYKELINNGLIPNRATYASLIHAYGRAQFCEDALAVYKEMKEKGMDLDTRLYNTLLATCADVGYTEQAIEIFEDMKGCDTCCPDSWTFSSLITLYSCIRKVEEAERLMTEMNESGFEPDILVLTSLAQCYGKAKRVDDVVKTFNQLLDMGIEPNDQFCDCLLNVMSQTPKEELGKLTDCVAKANPKLGSVVRYLVEGLEGDGEFKIDAIELFGSITNGVRRAFCNSLIDICINLDLLDKACVLLDLGLTLEIYTDLQSRSQTQWSLHLKGLSAGSALTAFHVWINDLAKSFESGEDLPPLLGINTGHGKHRYSEKGLAGVIESHLKELNAPFRESPDKAGWFLTTQVAVSSWIKSRDLSKLVIA